MFYYTFKGDQPDLGIGKTIVWCDQDTFYIESETTLSGDYTKVDSLPDACILNRSKELREAKDSKIEELNAACDKEIEEYESSALGEVYIYSGSIEDQINIIALGSAGVDAFFRCQRKGEERKHNIAHTAKQLAQVYADGTKHKSEAILRCGALKEKVEVASTVSEVNAITWETAVDTSVLPNK